MHLITEIQAPEAKWKEQNTQIMNIGLYFNITSSIIITRTSEGKN